MLEWERIDDWNERAKVFNGWIVKTLEPVAHDMIPHGRGIETGFDFRLATCFVLDPMHEWSVKPNG